MDSMRDSTDIASVAETPDGLVVIVPARRNLFALCFLPLWLMGWALGEVLVSYKIFTAWPAEPPEMFLVVWLAMWTVGGAVALGLWLWMLVGKERVVLGYAVLSLSRHLLGFSRTRDYDLSRVTNLRAGILPARAFGPRTPAQLRGLTGGTLQFEYEGKTIRFGLALKEAEAKRLCATMLARRSSLRPNE